MDNNIAVSIVVPSSNRARMLETALKSILGQTYKNWEAIIVANGCTDNTADIVEGYLSDTRFKFIDIKEPVGGAKARNIGIDEASGEYLAFLDDDDEWLPEKLGKQVEFLNNNEAAIVSCSYHVYRNGTFYGTTTMKKHVRMRDLLFQNVLGSFSFCMTRTEYAKGCRVNEQLDACQDWDLWVKIMDKTKIDSYSLEEPLVNYHEHPHFRLTTAYKKAEKARRIFLESHAGKMSERHKKYHALIDRILSAEDDKEHILSKLKNAVVFLFVTNTLNPYILYKTIIEYLLGIRSQKLRRTLKSLVDGVKSIMRGKERE